MEYDKNKVDEMVLALLFLTSSADQYSTKAWKGLPLETLGRLYEKGYISDPNSKSPTMTLSPEAARLSRDLFEEFFGIGREESA
jgi:hypothetical protein